VLHRGPFIARFDGAAVTRAGVALSADLARGPRPAGVAPRPAAVMTGHSEDLRSGRLDPLQRLVVQIALPRGDP
jgi:hypothetical protein